jgi:hypothetical protein
VPTAVQELAHRPGQYPGAGIVADLGGQADTAEEDLVLCFEPGQCLLVVIEAFGSDAGAGCGKRRHRHAIGVHQQGGGMAGVQVVIEHALDDCPSLGCRLVFGGLLGGVSAQQIVQAVAAGNMFGGQVGHGQRIERGTRAVLTDAQQRRRRGGGDVGTGMDAQQPEQPGWPLAEVLVGPREHRPHIGDRITGLQRPQLGRRAGQLGGHRSQRHGRPGGGPRRGDDQRQRQPPAQPGQLLNSGRLGPGPLGADAPGQQFAGLSVRQYVQGDQPRTLGGGQTDQPVPAGDQHHATGGSG